MTTSSRKSRREDIEEPLVAPSLADRLKLSGNPLNAAIGARTSDAAIAQETLDKSVEGRPGDMIDIPLENIDPNPFNARKIYKPERVNELAASLSAHGQMIPGLATRRGDRYVLAAGHYRLRAAKVAGLKTLKVVLREELSDRDLYELSYRENADREPQSALDNALAWRQLLDEKVYSSETELAEVTGMSLPNVNKTLSILRLSSGVLDAIEAAPEAFALSVLYELVLFEEVGGQSATFEWVTRIADGDAGRREIQEARQRLQAPKPRKRKETSRHYKILREGSWSGVLKEWDSGKVSLEVSISDPKERTALVSELRRRFGLQES
ncbi:ParB/RepB/Spo0J family partition protein [Thauera sp.]|jgi:ParB family chromosome partitioning protein|uniref:ParB/RepB/Spo0J family partition protein n=1 Tax=Thauera sp. TaxID=1905334 RepID=UPI00257C3FE9|nr:ParB/RepB/Spo0J family partition protein [Thauera sp.]